MAVSRDAFLRQEIIEYRAQLQNSMAAKASANAFSLSMAPFLKLSNFHLVFYFGKIQQSIKTKTTIK